MTSKRKIKEKNRSSLTHQDFVFNTFNTVRKILVRGFVQG